MDFKGHAVGGFLAASSMVGVLYLAGRVDFSAGFFISEKEGLFPFKGYEFTRDGVFAIRVFMITFVMSLFPDLDTGSIFQRWYFRGLFVGVICLLFYEQNSMALFLLFISILPLLGKHRGWMHTLWAPFGWALFLFIAYRLIFGEFLIDFTLTGFFELLNNVYKKFVEHFWSVLAIFVGYYTHLFLDSGLFRSKSASMRTH